MATASSLGRKAIAVSPPSWPSGSRTIFCSDHSAFRLTRDGEDVLVDSFDHRRGRSTRIRARAVILAMPHFVATHVQGEKSAPGMAYAPWIVANVTVARHPQGKGVPLAWDNVSTGSASLGYVVATHRDTSSGDGPTRCSAGICRSPTWRRRRRGL